MTLLTSIKASSSLHHLRRHEPDTGLGDAVNPRAAGRDERGPPGHGPISRQRYAIAGSAGSEAVRKAIARFDGYLSQCCGVKPFSPDERCLLRYAAISSSCAFDLSDGTVLRRGDLVIDLHLWNEHIPPEPKQGPDLAWARVVAQRMKHSLTLLAEAMDTRPEFEGAKAVRAKTNFVGWGAQNESLSRLIGRFGFEDVDEGVSSVPERVHDAFENILIGALTWTHNPEALRLETLIRQRRPVWMSAATLGARHRASVRTRAPSATPAGEGSLAAIGAPASTEAYRGG